MRNRADRTERAKRSHNSDGLGPLDLDHMAHPAQDVAHDHVNGLLQSHAGFALTDQREHGDVVDLTPTLSYVDVMNQTTTLEVQDRIEVVGTAQTSVDTGSDTSGCHVSLTGRERELVFDRGEPPEDTLTAPAVVGVFDPTDDRAVELVAGGPAFAIEHVLLEEREEGLHGGVVAR